MKNKIRPPRHFRRFFEWFCHPDFAEELTGDLEEVFVSNVEKGGLKKAKNMYRREVLKMFRPSVIKNIRISAPMSTDMFQNYIKIAWRNLKGHPLFSFINIAGLAIGMTVGLLIISMLNDLSQYDEFHVNKTRIHRVISTVQASAGQRTYEVATSSMPMAEKIKTEIPGVEEVIRIRRFFAEEVTANEKTLSLKGHMVDANFLSVFSFPLLEGNPESALEAPFSIVLTQDAVDKFFNGKNPIGETIQIGELGDYKVTGVLANVPTFSHLQFDMLGSFSTVAALEKEAKVYETINNWSDFYSNLTYVLLHENQSAEAIEATINEIGKTAYERLPDATPKFELQALNDIMPGRDLSNQPGPKMSFLPLIILSIIAFVVLLSACFNYTNLSIARALRRAREIGIRKVVGARRRQIATQLLMEAIMISLFSLALALGLFQVIKPGFFSLLPRSDQFVLNMTPSLLGYFVGFALLAGLLAGAVPAVFLARIKPALVLKNMVTAKLFNKLTVRKILIVFQFTISVAFIVATSIIYKQHQFALQRDMGFSKENILNVDLQTLDVQVFKNEFSKIPEIKNISLASQVVGGNTKLKNWIQKELGTDSLEIFSISVDEHYLNNHQIPLVAGLGFSQNSPTEVQKTLIVNEQSLIPLGFEKPADAIDQWIYLQGEAHQIIGVVKDFHYAHLEEPIRAFCFRYKPEWCHIANLKVASNDLPATMKKLEKSWTQVSKQPFSAHFLDAYIEETYQFLLNVMTLFGFFAALAISIACLGLLGMAVYTTETRLKEISLRKIFGASVGQLVFSLSRGFTVLLLIASLIATPLAYLLFDQVILNNFAYRVNIGPVELVSGFVLIFVLGLLTIGSQTWKAARTNPAEHLRGE